MPYPPRDQMLAVRMDSTNELVFIDKLHQLADTSIDKNRDWFPNLIKNYQNFEQWYLTFYREELVSFCAVQNFGGYYRLSSRLWNGIKKTGLELGVKYEEVSPAFLMIQLQLEDFPLNQFFSMEYLNRRPLMARLANKLNMWFEYEFELKEGMYCTVPSDRESAWCWQSIVSEIDIPLESISIEEYQRRFDKTRKTKK
jgi:hypothetical protein